MPVAELHTISNVVASHALNLTRLSHTKRRVEPFETKTFEQAQACMRLGATHKLAATAYHAAVMIAFLTRSQGGGRARCSRATTLFLRARVTAATRDCVSRLLRRSRRLRISAPSIEGSSTSAASPPVPAANMMMARLCTTLQCGQSHTHCQHAQCCKRERELGESVRGSRLVASLRRIFDLSPDKMSLLMDYYVVYLY